MAYLSNKSYGKERVRLTKILRDSVSGQHTVHEYTVDVMLHGDFDAIYTADDNTLCVATDTMKNTVYAIARTTAFDAPEEFGLELTRRFIDRFEQVQAVEVSIAMEPWKRITVDGAPHAHSFVKGHGQRTAMVRRSREEGIAIQAGVSGMEVFKSTGSAFSGFARDEYTLLPETEDRILATTVDASWDYSGIDLDFNREWTLVEQAILEVFATHQSPSLQSTLYLMGTTILDAVSGIDRVRFSMPNQHHIRFNLEAVGLDNPEEVFYGTDSPFGIITGEVSRDGLNGGD